MSKKKIERLRQSKPVVNKFFEQPARRSGREQDLPEVPPQNKLGSRAHHILREYEGKAARKVTGQFHQGNVIVREDLLKKLKDYALYRKRNLKGT
jgi:hypothetical protein